MRLPTIEVSKIMLYHIVHIDRLQKILRSGENGLLICDSKMHKTQNAGTVIGIRRIKERRLFSRLTSYPTLHVGDCVPFYFCPRSIMLYMLYRSNHIDLDYKGGQEPIIHLAFNMQKVINWANTNQRRWVFTDSNAGSYYFTDYKDLSHLNKLDWNAINAEQWTSCQDKKQAEFLIENSLPFDLIEEIGVFSNLYQNKAIDLLANTVHKTPVNIKKDWYY